MKLKLILLVSLLSFMIVGCSKEDNELVDQGRAALEKHEYDKARDLLSDALQADSADDEARAMYMQAVNMQKADEYEKQGNYKKAIKELELIEEIKYGSSSIKSEASAKKKELVKLDEEYQKAKQERKENAKEASKEGVYYAKQQASKVQAHILAQEEAKRKEEEKKQEEENKVDEKPQEENKPTEPVEPTPPVTQPETPSTPAPQSVGKKILDTVKDVLKADNSKKAMN